MVVSCICIVCLKKHSHHAEIDCGGIALPLMFSVVPAAAGQYVPLNTNPFCLPNANWAFANFYAPMALCLLVGTIAFAILLFYMLRVSDFSSVWSVKQNVRLIVFLFIQLVWASIFLAYRFSFVRPINDGPFGQNLSAFLACNIFAPCSRWDQPGWAVPAGFVWLVTIDIHLSGLLICLVFLSQPDLFSTPLSERSWPWRNVLAKSESTTTTQGSSSSSGSSSSFGESTLMSEMQ